MKKALLIFVVLAAVVGAWLIYFSSDSSATKVSSVSPEVNDITIKIELSGEVCPIKSYSVMSGLSGKIDRLYVKEGDKVQKGDNLLSLDQSAAVMAMAQNSSAANDPAAAAVMANSAAVSDAANQAAQEKAKVALALSQTTGIDYDSFNSALSPQIQEEAQAASSTLSELLKNQNTGTKSTPEVQKSSGSTLASTIQDELTQKSIMAGKVLKIIVNEGEVLAAGSPAMVIADDSGYKITCAVNEDDLKKITDDLKVNIITRSDNTLYEGKVISKSPAASKVSGGEYSGMEAVGAVDIQPQGGFNEIIGSTVDVNIILEEVKNVVILPLDCITGDNYIYVIKKDNTLEKRSVVKGLADGYNAQILSGVSLGEKVASNPEGLKQNEKVKIVD